MRIIILVLFIMSITTTAAAINIKPALGLSYSYLWDYSNTNKYHDTHILSIYGGLPVIKDKVSLGLSAGAHIPFVYNYKFHRSNEQYYDGSDLKCYMTKAEYDYLGKSSILSVSLPITIYINSFFLETAIGASFYIDRSIHNDTTIDYINSPQGYVQFDKKTEHFVYKNSYFSSLVTYSIGYQWNHFQFMITGKDFLSVGFEIRCLYWKR